VRKASSRFSRPRKQPFEENLLTQRDTLMAEITLRTTLGTVTPMIAKARTLLTRFWGEADWHERAEILPIARWLVQLGAAQRAMAAHGPAQRKRGRRKTPSASLST
jgi:hypothetical protein